MIKLSFNPDGTMITKCDITNCDIGKSRKLKEPEECLCCGDEQECAYKQLWDANTEEDLRAEMEATP